MKIKACLNNSVSKQSDDGCYCCVYAHDALCIYIIINLLQKIQESPLYLLHAEYQTGTIIRGGTDDIAITTYTGDS